MAGLNGYRELVDSFKAGASQESVISAGKEQLDKFKQDIKTSGTTTGSTQQVVPQSKKQKNETMQGGATFYTSEISPTDFVPNPDKQESAQTPDYYRNGLHKVETFEVDGEVAQRRVWAPVPQLIGERANPTLANIRLIDTRQQPNADDPNSPGKRLVPEYSKFFLESVSEAHQEKYQTVETFNDWYVYFYGERPPVYSFSGHLLNASNYNWLNEFNYYYQNFWRGTKAVELGAKVFLTYNYQQVQGYIISINTNINAVTDKAAPFQINMLVTKRLIFNGSQDDNVMSDSLIPTSDTGLINTSATAVPFSQQLTEGYLASLIPAKDNNAIDETNQDQGQRLVKDSAQSTVVQTTTRIGQDIIKSGQSIGASKAQSLQKAITGKFGP